MEPQSLFNSNCSEYTTKDTKDHSYLCIPLFSLLANDYEEPNHVLITAFGGKQGGYIPPLPELSGKRASKTSNTNKRERALWQARFGEQCKCITVGPNMS